MTCGNQETGKFTNLTINEIKDYLIEFKKLILDGKYIVSSREENDSFAYEYRIDTIKEKEILVNLQYTDFCYAVTNRKPGFEHEILYVFCKEYELDNWGILEMVEIYIKTNLTQTKSGNSFMVVISFHKRNKHLKYLFK